MEEIIWIRRNEFDRVISIIDAPHNLHNYDEYDVRYVHRPIFVGDYTPRVLEALFIDLTNLLENGEKLLLHHEELGDLLCGSLAGYLVWSRLVEAPPEAITVIERITGRVLGPIGRELVAASKELAGDRA